MSYNGSGTFNINTAGQPVVTGTVISSSVFNALTADLATGLSTCITKDGQTTVTANIPMNSFKFTNLAAGTAATDSVRLGQLQAGSATVITVTGTDTYTGTMSPALAAYAAGNMFTFVVPNTNTTACTINIDGLGAKSITRDGSTALVAGDLVANSEVTVIYDGTRFQVLNSNSKTNWTVSNALTLSAGTANGVAYLNGSKALTTGSALVFDGTNLGIGTSSPGQKLTVQGGLNVTSSATLPAAQGSMLFSYESAVNRCYIGDGTGYSFAFSKRASSTTTDLMTLTDSGNLGIGTSSPAYKLAVQGSAYITSTVGIGTTPGNYGGQVDIYANSNAAFNGIWVRNDSSGSSANAGIVLNASGNSWRMAIGSSANNSNALFWAVDAGGSPLTRLTLDTSGNLLVGTTTANGKLYVTGLTNSVCARFEAAASATGGLIQCINTSTSGSNTAIAFQQNGSSVGSITTSNTTTTYNTSSDYRLKDNIAPMTGALAKVAALKPVTYKWKIDGSDGEGFIAHELQAVVPQCVTGEKDAVDENGNPKYQGIDTSFLVATLTAAIQEQQALITALTARVAQLESK